jgi:hypothetical protein
MTEDRKKNKKEAKQNLPFQPDLVVAIAVMRPGIDTLNRQSPGKGGLAGTVFLPGQGVTV